MGLVVLRVDWSGGGGGGGGRSVPGRGGAGGGRTWPVGGGLGRSCDDGEGVLVREVF